MDNRATIKEELKELQVSFIDGDVGGKIHFVPDDYFVHFPGQLAEAIEQNNIIENFPKEVPYHIPEAYFNDFIHQLNERLVSMPAQEEIESISPLLAGLKKKPTFELPDENYFEQLVVSPASPVQKVLPQSVPHPALRTIKWMRWVAAAAILCIFSIGGINFFAGNNNSEASDAAIQAALADISDASIQQYLNNNMDTYDLYSSISDKEINRHLTSQEEKMLNNISDEEIEKVLESQIN